MVVGVPEKSGNGSATLTSAAKEGQAASGRSPARAPVATVRTPDSVAGAAQLACVLEVSAEKPGNITPSYDFRDTSYEDMLRSAIAVGPDERVEHDVRSEPSVGLREAMASAAERDSVAAEYATDYALTFEIGVPALVVALGDGLAVRDAIVELHLRLLDHAPDTLIARKCGADATARVSAGAREA